MMHAPAHVILQRVAAGTAGTDELAWLRQRLADDLAAPERGAEAALWLDRAPGEPPWWLVERRRQRDGLILRLWRERFPKLKAWDAADRILIAQRRYAGTAWHHHRRLHTPPADATAALLWAAMRTGVRFPTSRRRVFEILRTADRDALY